MEFVSAIYLSASYIVCGIEKGLAAKVRLTEQKPGRLPACLPVFHQLLHVADALDWLGPMHVYSQWGMERMCGMITRTAKSRVSANRNMELTLLLTEQKHILGYVLNGADWPTDAGRHSLPEPGSDSSAESHVGFGVRDIEDADGNVSLFKAFSHRLSASHPQAVRTSISTSGQRRFCFTGMVQARPPDAVERQRIRDFMAGLDNYDRDQVSPPTTIAIWRWCKFRDRDDNKKADFKVTSRKYKRANNTRNASTVSYTNSDGQQSYAEVQFFFGARLPSELGGVEDSDSDSDDASGTALHHLAYVRTIPVEPKGHLVRKRNNRGALAVIAVETIVTLIGRLKVANHEYLTNRFTSMLGRRNLQRYILITWLENQGVWPY